MVAIPGPGARRRGAVDDVLADDPVAEVAQGVELFVTLVAQGLPDDADPLAGGGVEVDGAAVSLDELVLLVPGVAVAAPLPSYWCGQVSKSGVPPRKSAEAVASAHPVRDRKQSPGTSASLYSSG